MKNKKKQKWLVAFTLIIALLLLASCSKKVTLESYWNEHPDEKEDFIRGFKSESPGMDLDVKDNTIYATAHYNVELSDAQKEQVTSQIKASWADNEEGKEALSLMQTGIKELETSYQIEGIALKLSFLDKNGQEFYNMLVTSDSIK